MMTRLLREDGPDHVIAAQLRRVVPLVSCEIANKIRGEYVLPRKRCHVVVQMAAQILSFFLLIREIRYVESLTVEKQVEAEEILVAWRVVEFEKRLHRLAVVMKILNR